MLTIFILLCFAWGFYTGYRRGLALQLVYIVGYIFSFILAMVKYKELGKRLELWVPYPSATEGTKMFFFDEKTTLDLDMAFYAGVAFVLIYFVGVLVVHLLAIFAHHLQYVPLLKGNHGIIWGGALSALSVYFGVFLLLYLLSMVPMTSLQNLLGNDPLSRAMIERTPFFSKALGRLWVENILNLK
ncbi:MAG: CvpA family protein [Lactobacillales bacterium]|jgi:uncharacterized membrane protein required for colicin V production|nr:CvpA family protein [Lactobacillales bacterium]